MTKHLIAALLATSALFYRLDAMQDEIRHVVVVMLENRSFDNILAWLYDNGDAPAQFVPTSSSSLPYQGLTDATLSLYKNSLVNSAGNVVFSSHPIKGVPSTAHRTLLNSPKYNPHEPYPHVLKQIYGKEGSATPNMSGFLQDYATLWQEFDWRDNQQEICAVMETYTAKELPVLYALARNFAVSDMWFSSVPTQTNPNRAFAACGTSEGEVVNGALGTNTFFADTVWNRLYEESPETTWTIFWQGDMLPGIIPGSYYKNLFHALDQIPEIDDHFEYIDLFHERARNGQLPHFSFIEPQWTISIGIDDDWILPEIFKKGLHMGIQGNDLHPPGDVRTAENFLANVYTSLSANKEAWERTLLVITFDEHGGLYDHVPPPAAVQPDAYCQHGFKFDRLGVRVPTIFVSPKVARGTVVRSGDGAHPFDHTSLISTVLKWCGVEKDRWAMGCRVDAAPTFEGVVTLADARSDCVLTPHESQPSIPHGEPLKMGDAFFLKNKDGKYFIAPKQPFGGFAQVGGVEEKIAMSFINGSGPVTHGSFAVIQAHDPSMGSDNILEISLTHCDCLYCERKKTPRQWWTVKSVDRPALGSPICCGDRVYLESHIYLDPFQFIPARLGKRNIPFINLVTTTPVTSKESDDLYWTIEKAR